MKTIDISTRKFPNTFALVDDEDFAAISANKWRAMPGKHTLYAVRWAWIDGEKKMLLMHRVVSGLGVGRSPQVDHSNGNGLDKSAYLLEQRERKEQASADQ